MKRESTQWNNLIDPFVGIRVGAYLTERFAVMFRGISAGSVSTIRPLNQNGVGRVLVLEYDFTRVVSLEAAYLALAINIMDKNLRVNNEMKFTAQGPVVGVSFRF